MTAVDFWLRRKFYRVSNSEVVSVWIRVGETERYGDDASEHESIRAYRIEA
jgi:hypothetical protein